MANRKKVTEQIVTELIFRTIFLKIFSFNDHFKLSHSFLDPLSATLFLLELIYNAWTHNYFLELPEIFQK